MPRVRAPPDKKNRQELTNFADLQYFSTINVGGQQITGIIDTGSFDVVVFDKKCQGCGRAARYASSNSTTYTPNPDIKQELNYGSGSVSTMEAFDQISIGPYNNVNLSFWNAYAAYMPVLRNARFQSIIGVGPPETPAADAWSLAKQTINSIEAGLKAGVAPSQVLESRLVEKARLSEELSLTPRLVQANNVAMFSICLGYKPGSAGWFVWDDHNPDADPDAFKYVPVLGIHTWTVNMTNVALAPRSGSPFTVACEDGCGTIIDSGTSLLLMPSMAVQRLNRILDSEVDHWDCSDLSTLPEFTFELGGHLLSLPPDAYVARLEDQVPAEMASFVAKRQLRNCQLAVMESYAETNWGPLWILGMPFFRKYYTTFKFGSNHSDRAVMVARASPDCTPEASPEASLAKNDQASFLRTYNVSDMFLNQNVLKARGKWFNL